jgi:hypothetical protein
MIKYSPCFCGDFLLEASSALISLGFSKTQAKEAAKKTQKKSSAKYINGKYLHVYFGIKTNFSNKIAFQLLQAFFSLARIPRVNRWFLP